MKPLTAPRENTNGAAAPSAAPHGAKPRPAASLPLLLLLASIALVGCGGGVVGTTGYQREFTPAETALQKGFQEFALGHYSNAIEEFNNVLAFKHTPEQENEANVGLGWSKTRSLGIAEGWPHFDKVKNIDNDAKIGAAGYWLSTANRDNAQKGVDLLTTMGLDAVEFIYKPRRDYGVNNTKAHALIAALYQYVGEIEKAKAHAKKAKELNVPPAEPPYESVTQIISFIESRAQ